MCIILKKELFSLMIIKKYDFRKPIIPVCKIKQNSDKMLSK